jgi:hypothetical protein
MNRIAAVSPLLVIATLLLGGCATGAKPEGMVVQRSAVPHGIASTVSVAVSGGSKTSSTSASQISDDAFAQALRDSITKTGLFKEVSADGGRYRLTAFIGKVDQPMMGFAMTVKMEVSYKLVDMQDGQTVWAKDIASEHTAQVSEAFAGIKRLRMANEGAAQANIEQAIAALSALPL